jgi:predicted lysophospholipase L1 biosynthesis ABC-type transport system permease subunit
VVGVVGSVRFWGPLVPGAPELFLVFRPDHPGVAPAPRAFTVVVRPSAHARALAPELRQIAETAEPRAVIGAVRTGDAWLEDALATPRERAVLLALLGAFGLLLTLVGIFGMTAYAVARRTQEIGVRVAIGATPADVLTMMLIDVAKPVAMGIAIGLAGAAFATRIIALSLFETTPTDPGTFSIVR